jgi:hypothetical protein
LAKSFELSKHAVWDAYLAVKANKGAAGMDGQSMEDFEADLKNNLYKLWNRLSSDSYFPPPVKRVEIPKANGKLRPLGIPTIADRIAHQIRRRFTQCSLELCEEKTKIVYCKDSNRNGSYPNQSLIFWDTPSDPEVFAIATAGSLSVFHRP